MPVYVSYIADEKRIDLVFKGNLDLNLSQEIWGICRSASPNVKSCIIDLSSVHHVFDSGIALLQLLYLRLSELGIIVVILSDHPKVQERIPILAQNLSYPSPVRSSGQSDLCSRSVEPNLNT